MQFDRHGVPVEVERDDPVELDELGYERIQTLCMEPLSGYGGNSFGQLAVLAIERLANWLAIEQRTHHFPRSIGKRVGPVPC